MIETERLIIRRFNIEDAYDVYESCNDFEVVKTTLGIPWLIAPVSASIFTWLFPLVFVSSLLSPISILVI